MRVPLAVVLCMFALSSVRADDMQFTFGTGAAYAAYTEVRVFDSANREVFKGTTDRYGRISISLVAGSYRAVVKTATGELNTHVQITGAAHLRAISL